MTVGELRKALEGVPDEVPVVIQAEEYRIELTEARIIRFEIEDNVSGGTFPNPHFLLD